MKSILGIIIVIAVGVFLFMSYGDRDIDISSGTDPDINLVSGQALIDNIDILILESFPVQVMVAIEGSLADSCTELGDIITDRNGNEFTANVTTLRPAEAFCAQMIKSFEKSVPLNVRGLKAGTYTVTVNNLQDTFTLDIDNILPE